MFIYFFHTELRSCVNRTHFLLFLSFSPCFSCHTQSPLFLSYTVPAFPVIHSPRFSCHTQSPLFLSYTVPAFPVIHSPRFSCHYRNQSLFRPLSRVQVIFDCKSRFGHNMQLCVSVGPHSSGAVWESRWPSWAVRPNEPSGFRGRKDLLNRASALVTTCP